MIGIALIFSMSAFSLANANDNSTNSNNNNDTQLSNTSWQSVIRNTRDWQSTLYIAQARINKEDNYRQQFISDKTCSKPADTASVLYMQPQVFNQILGNALYKNKPNTLTNLLQVNTSSQLVLSKNEAVQILPSLNNINQALNSKGVKGNLTNLAQNMSGIIIPEAIYKMVHPDGMTESLDKDLREATLNEMVDTAYFLDKNPQYQVTGSEYLAQAVGVYLRNIDLCLYNL